MSIKSVAQLFLYNIPRHVYYALIFVVLTWSWFGLKKIEPVLFPVVKDFKIDEVKRNFPTLEIRGTFKKTRDCVYQDIVSYSHGALVFIDFNEKHEPVNRVTGEQEWGWWLVTPPVHDIDIYVRHKCLTGIVTTHMFSGSL